MRVIQIAKPNAPFELVERPIPEPGPRQVRIKVEACGICHSDVFAATGTFPGVHYPAVPGHEVAGRIDAIGPDVTTWKSGSASASAGSAAPASSAIAAGAATSSPAAISKSPASTMTAAMPTT